MVGFYHVETTAVLKHSHPISVHHNVWIGAGVYDLGSPGPETGQPKVEGTSDPYAHLTGSRQILKKNCIERYGNSWIWCFWSLSHTSVAPNLTILFLICVVTPKYPFNSEKTWLTLQSVCSIRDSITLTIDLNVLIYLTDEWSFTRWFNFFFFHVTTEKTKRCSAPTIYKADCLKLLRPISQI